MKIRRRLIAGIIVLVALGSCILIQHTLDADEIARLRRYSPHGHHFIDTAFTGGKVKWTSREIMIWKVRRKSHEFQTVSEFEAAFLNVCGLG